MYFSFRFACAETEVAADLATFINNFNQNEAYCLASHCARLEDDKQKKNATLKFDSVHACPVTNE